MAVSEQAGPVTDPRECASGREFVRDRLAESDGPLSPAELSEEYDCTNGYMRDILSDLNSEGVAERVTTGRYVLAGGGPPDANDDLGEDTDGSVLGVSDDDMADLPGEDTDADGSDDMPTQDEYRRQHSDSDDEQADVSASSEPTGSGGNTSASVGSDAPDDGGGGDGDEPVAAAGAPIAPLPMNPKTFGMLLGVALILWLAYRAFGDESGSESEPDAEQADDTGEIGGGLTG